MKDRSTHKRLKKLMKGPAAGCDDLLSDILQLASSFEEVAVRMIPRGKGLQSRYLAREAAGLPRFKGQSDNSDGESWFCLGWAAEELDFPDDSDPAFEWFEATPDEVIPLLTR